MIQRFVALNVCLLLFCCSDEARDSKSSMLVAGSNAQAAPFSISYQQQVRPILESKCVACHACYDSPCQLNLASATGLLRGAHKNHVYSSTRLRAANPTRLFIDALDEKGWRKQGFFSVLEQTADNPAILQKMLQLGRGNTLNDNERLDDKFDLEIARNNVCPTGDEFAQIEAHSGMPYAVAGLSDAEYATLAQWLKAGAPVDERQTLISPQEYKRIAYWEDLLNGDSNKQRLAARYLYEHLFIAHLYFSDLSLKNFYRLVRSTTAPGEAIKPVATTRPNDDPGVEFWYRLMPLQGALVYKTHITYALNEQKSARFQELFFDADWRVATLPGYSSAERSNPFLTFASIPARSRYQFMLDDAAFFVRSFIRGPVCHGQIATDVIRDRFWNLFQAPESDIFVIDPDYRKEVTGLLALPGIDDDLPDFVPQWLDHRKRNQQYMKKRQAAYQSHFPAGPEINGLWHGDGNKADALMTIFRHHNNAAIQTGLIGTTPKTIWVMDYALFERSYYVLVGNFNVFGNLTHQTLTRLYFDLIRNGAEQNFLRFLPAESRPGLIKDWYLGAATLKLYLTYDEVDTTVPSAIDYRGDAPMIEFAAHVRKSMADLLFEPATRLHRAETILMPLTHQNAAALPFIKFMPDVSFLRIFDAKGKRVVYSLLRDRAHSNVAFMLGEELRYMPNEDRLTLYPGILGSYPNFMFNLPLVELADFSEALRSTKTQVQFRELVKTWGIRRSHPQFWTLLHDMTRYLDETLPREAGIFDISRYHNL